MGVFNTDTFLERLALMIQSAAGTAAAQFSGTPRALWLYEAEEGDHCTDPYTTMAAYAGGAIEWVPVATVPTQLLIVGTDPAATVNRANLIMQTFLDSQGRPKQMIDLGGSYRLHGVIVRPPASLPADDRGRSRLVLNIDARGANVG